MRSARSEARLARSDALSEALRSQGQGARGGRRGRRGGASDAGVQAADNLIVVERGLDLVADQRHALHQVH